jgi:hypothetical protein
MHTAATPNSEEADIQTDVSLRPTQPEMQTTASTKSEENSTSGKATSPDFSQYTRPLDPPFPQRLVKASMEKQYKNFLKVLKYFQINIPLLKALQQMPNYAKFLRQYP